MADLVQLASTLETGTGGFHSDQADAFGAGGRVGLAHHDDQVGDQAMADEGLAAVDHVLVAIAHGGGAHGLEVAAGARLGHGDGQDQLAGTGTRQPSLFLLFIAAAGDVRGDDIGMHAEIGTTDTGLGEGFVEHRAMAEIATTTAVFARQGDAQQAFAAGLEPGFTVDLARLVPGGLARYAFALEKALRRGAENLMVVAKDGAVNVHVALHLPAVRAFQAQGLGWRTNLVVSAGGELPPTSGGKARLLSASARRLRSALLHADGQRRHRAW
ncbi:hypothetical protein D3C76_340400 [compost metagenome]